MPSRSFLALLLLALACARAGALVVGRDAPADFVLRSRRDPGRLYALVVGATWCQPCRKLTGALAAVRARESRPAARAAWNKIDEDVFGRDRLLRFLADVHAAQPGAIPYALVFRAGKVVGYSSPSGELASVESFLADAQARSGTSPFLAPPRLICPGPDSAPFAVGVNGRRRLEAEDPSDDVFGLETLLAFDAGAARRAFYTPVVSPPPKAYASPSGAGFFFAASPLDDLGPTLRPSAELTGDRFAAEFPNEPGRDLRLILTGHGGPEGLMLRPPRNVVAGDDGDAYAPGDPPVYLKPADVARAVAAARRNGKRVRGLVLSCYGGKFGDAFMPTPGASAPACAAFASLPDKKSEGCYTDDDSGPRQDYASVAARLTRCDGKVDGRVRHYRIAAAEDFWGTPMLSSEYFLLYGPGASYLGRADSAPAPDGGVGAVAVGMSNPRVVAYIDMIGRGVLSVRAGDRELPLPRVSVVDCRVSGHHANSLDEVSEAGSFFLRGRAGEDGQGRRADCAPILKLSWDPALGLRDTRVDFANLYTYVETDATAPAYVRAFIASLSPRLWSVSIKGLKPEARVLLSVVLPEFRDELNSGALVDKLEAVAARLHPTDAPLAEALAVLAERHRKKYLFGTDEFVKAMWNNIDPQDAIEYRTSELYRIAHLTAAAEAELSLRAQAASSPEAKRLLEQFESLQDCERELY